MQSARSRGRARRRSPRPAQSRPMHGGDSHGRSRRSPYFPTLVGVAAKGLVPNNREIDHLAPPRHIRLDQPVHEPRDAPRQGRGPGSRTERSRTADRGPFRDRSASPRRGIFLERCARLRADDIRTHRGYPPTRHCTHQTKDSARGMSISRLRARTRLHRQPDSTLVIPMFYGGCAPGGGILAVGD